MSSKEINDCHGMIVNGECGAIGEKDAQKRQKRAFMIGKGDVIRVMIGAIRLKMAQFEGKWRSGAESGAFRSG